MATKGYGGPRSRRGLRPSARAVPAARRDAQLFPVSWGLVGILSRASGVADARELGEQLPNLAQSTRSFPPRGGPPSAGEYFILPRRAQPQPETHLEQVIALYEPQQHRSLAFSLLS